MNAVALSAVSWSSDTTDNRSTRTMNHMDPETKIVHLQLEEWGRWSKGENHQGQIGPTPMARAVEEGLHGAGQQSKPPISMPDHIAAVDVAVARLGQIDKKIVVEYYQHWNPIEVSARRVGMRVREFQNVLRRARWRILGYLDAKNI